MKPFLEDEDKLSNLYS